MRCLATLLAWVAALLFTATPARAEQLRGDPSAIALAERMIEMIGGRERWARAKSLHIVEESYSAGADDPTRDVYRRDLVRPRIRADYPEGPLIITPDGSWRSDGGAIIRWDEARNRNFAQNWSSNIYILYRRLATGDPALELRSESERRFAVVEAGRKIATYETTVGGAPVRWQRFGPSANGAASEEWIYGPLRPFADFSFPAWGARIDGSERFYYQEVRLDQAELPDALFPPPP